MTGFLLCLAVVIVLGACALIGCLLETRADPYVPEAAEAPRDPWSDREPRCRLHPAPRVVAGSDLDRHRRPIAEVNADLAALIDADPQLASLRGLDLSAYYVTPEGDR